MLLGGRSPLAQEIPGFEIAIEACAAFPGREPDRSFLGAHAAGGDDVPDVDGDDVGGDEVNFPEKKAHTLGGGQAAGVGLRPDLMDGGFDLDAIGQAVALDHEIVGGGVAPGLGDAELLFNGTGDEADLGPLAALGTISELF